MVTTDNKAEETHGLELIQTIHAGFEANNKYGVFANHHATKIESEHRAPNNGAERFVSGERRVKIKPTKTQEWSSAVKAVSQEQSREGDTSFKRVPLTG